MSSHGRYARRAMVWSALLVVIVYAGDYAWARLRTAYPGLGNAFDSVQVTRLLAIPLKSGKTEYEMDALQPEMTVTCVRALFGHLGYPPCWYVRRNSQKPIPMVLFFR